MGYILASHACHIYMKHISLVQTFHLKKTDIGGFFGFFFFQKTTTNCYKYAILFSDLTSHIP